MPKLGQLKQGQMDPALKEGGVWHPITIPDVDEPLNIKLRSVSSNKARTWEHVRFRAQRRYYEDDKIPPVAVLDQNECDKLAEALVTEWDLLDDDGQPVPCTEENVRSIMSQLPDVRFDALQKAAKKESYRVAQVAAIAGNSAAPSTPTSATAAGVG